MHSKVDAAGTDECAPDDGQSCPKPERILKEVQVILIGLYASRVEVKTWESTEVIYEFGNSTKLGSFDYKNGNF